MKTRWLKDYKESEKAAVKQQVKNAKLVLDRLTELLQEDLDTSVKEMSSRKHFDSNSRNRDCVKKLPVTLSRNMLM